MIRRVAFYRHDLGQPELDCVAEVLRGEILTTGEYVSRFEQGFSEYLRTDHALAVSSCTGALHLSLLGLGIGAGDEVITTPMTFVASSTAILEAGAKPVFVDVERDTGNMDVGLVEAAITSRTKAILPVHLYGLMCDMRGLRAIADRYGLKIIEDAAHCIEGIRDGIRPGQLGDTACFSFYATKNLTCGEGGAVTTNDSELYRRMRLLHLHGVTKTAYDRSREGYAHWDMLDLGWKYNMSNIEAAILLPQLPHIAEKLAKRTRVARVYDELLAGISEIMRPSTRRDCVHARHLYTIQVASDKRDRIMEALKADGIGCVVNYRAIHLLSYFSERYGYRPGDFPVAEAIGDSTISLPFYPALPPADAEYVVDRLKRANQIE